jgi:predicted transcriptional regulator
MAANLITLSPEMEVMQAISILLKNRISGAPVLDSMDNMVGILSEKDCLGVALETGYNEGRGGKVSDYMSDNVATVNADDSIIDIAKMFIETPYKRFPVIDDNRLVGQISRRDALKAIDTLL